MEGENRTFQIYKKGQATIARMATACALLAFVGFGCGALYPALLEIVSSTAASLAVGILFVGFAALIAWLVNKPAVVDFLIAAELELRKVSWPTRPELLRQTVVVVATVILFAIVLLIANYIMGQFMSLFVVS